MVATCHQRRMMQTVYLPERLGKYGFRRRFLLCQGGQGFAEEPVEGFIGHAAQARQRPFRQRPLITQVDQRRDHVFFHGRSRGGDFGTPNASSLSRSSSTMRSAVFLPMPGIRVSEAMLLPLMAATIASAGMPLRIVIASLGPMPLTLISFSKSCFSSLRKKPNRASASSRTWVCTNMATSAPRAGRAEKVGMLMLTSYPKPAASTMAWLGCLEISLPRRCAIIFF